MNLLSNAVKFTQDGEIEVKAWFKEPSSQKKRSQPASEEDRDQNKGGLVYLSVRDTGCGISDQDAKKLFKDFTTLKSSAALNPNGVGLGLSICKKICNLLKGDINVSSEPNQGSTFTFYVTADLSVKESELDPSSFAI